MATALPSSGQALPADWEQMTTLLSLPEADQLPVGQAGGATWAAAMGLRFTIKHKGMYSKSDRTNIFYDTRFIGDRHGRKVIVHPSVPMWPRLLRWGTIGPRICTTRVTVAAPRFALRSRRGALVADGDCDPRITSDLESLTAAHHWSRLRVRGDGGGVTVTWLLPSTMSQTRPQWPYHLWLAERLTDRLGL